MGLAKRMMEEAESSFEAQWECPHCEHENESLFEIPVIDMTSDRASDFHAREEVEWECDSCEKTIEGAIINNIHGVDFQFVDDDMNVIHIEADIPNDDYLDDYDYYWVPSDSPDDVFKVTLEGMRELIGNKSPSEHDEQLLNRVVFSQIITALEAYLADTLINLVKGSKDIQKQLYALDKELKGEKFTGTQILEDPDLPEKALIQYLQRLSFHNFPIIDNLFKIAINHSIFKDDDQRNLLNAARIYRHDCVHRNGKTKDGESLKIFDNDYVIEIANSAENLVKQLEYKLAFPDKENVTLADILGKALRSKPS